MRLTVSEFRNQIRVALNAVERGEEVYITRHNKTFAVIRIESTPVGKNEFHKIATDLESSPVRPDKWHSPEFDTPIADMKLPKCCSLKTPCKHWIVAGDRDGYINTISGEFREYDL